MTTLPVTKNRFSDTYSNNRKLCGTPGENALTSILSSERIPYEWQMPVQRDDVEDVSDEPQYYIIDTLVLPKIAVEVFGKIHGRTLRMDRHDERKKKYLLAHDYIYLEFTDYEVIFEAEKVLNAIRAEMH
jgi:Protein of unknown function (DUF559)